MERRRRGTLRSNQIRLVPHLRRSFLPADFIPRPAGAYLIPALRALFRPGNRSFERVSDGESGRIVSYGQFHARFFGSRECKGLLQIGNQVCDIFYPHRESNEPIGEPALETQLAWDRGMSHE